MVCLGFLVLALSVSHGLGYSLAPLLTWPEEYYFEAEEINLYSGIVKPFEIWYSSKHNRSRISFYKDTVSRYYFGIYIDEDGEEHDGKIYMIHPVATSDDAGFEVRCEILPSWGDMEDFLPSLESFVYSGTEEHDGKSLQVWKRKVTAADLYWEEEMLLVALVEDGIGIPVRHYTKKFDVKYGSLQGNKVINYFAYSSKVKKGDLDPHRDDCGSYFENNKDFNKAIKVLHPSIESDVDVAFDKYKEHHKREYVDEEHDYRRTIFKHRWQFIDDHNTRNLSYKLGLNQFADKTKAELAYLSGMKVSDPIREGSIKFPQKEIEEISDDLPENFDLRSLGVISPVRDQAHCGSCWAFAAASTMEGAIARVNGGHLVDLSEQSLVDCAWEYKSHGCGGTEEIEAVYQYLEANGIPTVEDYGLYLEEDGICKIHNMTSLYKIKGYVGVTKNSANAMKAAVYKYGPVTVGIEVTERLMFYKSGIFYDYECSPGAMNHAVTLVGYGVKDGTQFWTIKNSWSESWGDSGYIKMSATDDNCNVMHSPYYPVV